LVVNAEGDRDVRDDERLATVGSGAAHDVIACVDPLRAGRQAPVANDPGWFPRAGQ